MKKPFERVVTEHGATVLRVCRAVLGAHADAEDAWSETFLSALRSYPALPDDANVQAWLVTIAHRKAIDVTRGRRSRPITVDELPERPSTIGDPEAGDHELWGAVASLPNRQRQAIAFHYLGGLSHTETAQLIGGTADAVRRAAADGMKTLRARYGADERSAR